MDPYLKTLYLSVLLGTSCLQIGISHMEFSLVLHTNNQMYNMNILRWNIKGAGRKGSEAQLNLIIITHNPDIMFLTKTEVN